MKKKFLIICGFVIIIVLGSASYLLLVKGFEIFISDAATRLAYQIRDEAAELQRSGETSRTFEHYPKEWPKGVTGDYTVKIGDSIGVTPPGSGTTHHRRFVVVPNTLTVSHKKGEPTAITLEMKDGQVLLTGLR